MSQFSVTATGIRIVLGARPRELGRPAPEPILTATAPNSSAPGGGIPKTGESLTPTCQPPRSPWGRAIAATVAPVARK